MAGFSPDWLALREPADHRARDPGLASAASAFLEGRRPARILDLGCGTGSILRALSPGLGPAQHWRLVDLDPQLLSAARTVLSRFGRVVDDSEAGLRIETDHADIAVEFVPADLVRDLDAVLDPALDLVTAAALSDLVSPAWIEQFADRLAARRLPLYTTLIYDGTESWTPPDPLDEPVLAAFLDHQSRDKGFGPSAGPGATDLLRRAFESRGYTVRTAESPWRLGPDDRALMAELAAGIASAAAETGKVPAEDVSAWARRRATAESAVIGHRDLWAFPQ
jgi:SAM-dependent methyltransferase